MPSFNPKTVAKRAQPYLRRMTRATNKTQRAFLGGDIDYATARARMRDAIRGALDRIVTEVFVRPMVREMVKTALRKGKR